MSVSSLGDGRALRLGAVISAMAAVSMIYLISLPLMALVLERQGVPAWLIGLSAAAQAAAAFVVAPLLPHLMRRVGPGRVMQVSMVTAACIFPVMGLFQDLWAWFPLRFLLGAAASSLWVASETWINSMTPDAVRGRVLGIYSAVGSAGSALAPLVLIVVGTEGQAPFLAAAGICLLGLVPLLLAGSGSGALPGRSSQPMVRFLFLAPVPFLGLLLYAGAAESLGTFLPSYGIGRGLAEGEALSLLTAIMVGSLLLQVPIGWAADRTSAIGVLLATAILAAAGTLALGPVIDGPGWLQLGYCALLGGALHAPYSLTLLLLGQRFRDGELGAATALFSLMWNSGLLLGPPLTGLMIGLAGPQGLIASTAGLFVLVTLIAHLGRRS
ncbi:MFS transporter [Zavarzinia sp. CC-PAN008]|uniref:MFS transporter n=1 Tax=Zavarzinia sp. CC-PAN008 TaxID=3243332 RepID=UPI003F746A9E